MLTGEGTPTLSAILRRKPATNAPWEIGSIFAVIIIKMGKAVQ
jgi:hypothetical protein